MFTHILLPSDLHSLDTDAIQQSLDLAAKHHAAVSILHVIEPIQGIPEEELSDFYASLERSAQGKMAQLSRTYLDRHIPCTTSTRLGPRARTIVGFAEENGVDLIVMQSHRIEAGTGGAPGFTISYNVALFAQCPVLLVK